MFIENNKIHWRFHVGTRGNLSVAGVTSLKMELFADQRYGRYFSAQASGSFSGTAQWSREIDIKNTPGGYIGLSAEDARVPWLVSTHSTATQVRLFDGRGDFPARLISAVAQDSSSFEGEIVILESRADKENYLLKQKEGVL